MENKNAEVEAVTEPKIEQRIGYGKENATLSKTAIKYYSIATFLSLSILFLLKSPEPDFVNNSGIKSPDISQFNSGNSRDLLETYSISQQSEKKKSNTPSRTRVVILKLPGLEKIDRRRVGQIPPGSLIKAVLITGASNGPVRAEVLESLRVQGEALIPQGSTLLGVGKSAEDRLFIRFTQVVMKDGSFESVQGHAADLTDKTVGLKGSKVGRYALKYATAIGLNFVGGMAEGLQERDLIGQQIVKRSSATNALLSGTSKATLEMASDTMAGLKNSTPAIQIKAGKEIFVIFENGSQ